MIFNFNFNERLNSNTLKINAIGKHQREIYISFANYIMEICLEVDIICVKRQASQLHCICNSTV